MSNAKKQVFVKFKEHKDVVRYVPVEDEQSGKPMASSVYVDKSWLPTPYPQKIEMTVSAVEG